MQTGIAKKLMHAACCSVPGGTGKERQYGCKDAASEQPKEEKSWQGKIRQYMEFTQIVTVWK